MRNEQMKEVSNIDLIKNQVLDFSSPDYCYIAICINREKDGGDSKAFR